MRRKYTGLKLFTDETNVKYVVTERSIYLLILYVNIIEKIRNENADMSSINYCVKQ